MRSLTIIALAALIGCAGEGSYSDVSGRNAEGLKTAPAWSLEEVYCDYQKPEQWAELRRRGLVRDEYKRLIDAHTLQIGMSESEMQASWGGLSFCASHTLLNPVLCGLYPANKTITSGGTHIQWHNVDGAYVYTDNGVVTAIQQ